MATQRIGVLVKWVQKLDQNQPIQIFGDGSQTMDWVHVRDIVRANLLAPNRPFPRAYSMSEQARCETP